ncbi:RHS repeat-associated core domain-containing protein [Paenimyroides ummariense]|uniref:RHS repeat-associated core domain-containing protein n=1 Tax=Paenimyroides ummariense TaxID=913024 RepID=A0A1I5GVL0_9FLAO|nr:RHS repeat-associated core domain-containing protein [Paenimyroides ummariense]SFO40042.1 RHS repeat-associated core domain-containing protein [Paenimyroides ummariense]
MSYADCDGNGTINPATEILEENNYYPFGLQHTGYNDIANSCRNEEAEAYKFLNKEYEDSFALNVTETDFRHYDSALGRFNVLDPMAELAPDFTPYRYGFNNPVFWEDSTGLFETEEQARAFALDNDIGNYKLSFNRESKGYTLTIIGGEFDGRSFYDFVEVLPDLLIDIDGSGSGGGRNVGGAMDSFGLGLGALGTISSATSEYAMYKVASGFKSNNNLWDFQKLSPKQQNWRINAELGPKGNAVLGKHGLKILKYSKAAGVVGTAVGVGYSGYKIYNGTATTIDYVDAGVGTASIVATVFLASNPVGWAIGAGAGLYFAGRFIYDVTQE